ncbi:MAG: signal recognition particle-docking protein FtsY [Dehalococcoidia bacterium]|nr:signal recognition particle-docking protein FtsY [Dehalococcoidia bacterium]HCU99807.1 signal recognition particle-docking protein FtsY [Dehalococcoidia bacterium]|tara:strand:+ start:2642 stop:3640 length:999 start_codon:yes stop_codon:yes gene_type:complete
MRFWRKLQSPESIQAGVGDSAFTSEQIGEIQVQSDRALARSRSGLLGQLGRLFDRTEFGDDLWEELEEILIGADAGIVTTERILKRVRQKVREASASTSVEVREILRNELVAILKAPQGSAPRWDEPFPALLIILVVGVNGAGKTTSIAKLASAFKAGGQAPILAAADTFRAAAIDQLRSWGDLLDVRVVGHLPGGDPGAVVFDTLSAAEADGAAVALIDTAGRLHTKANLMQELKKVTKVIQGRYPEAPHETLLVIDATTGQNGLLQARAFTDAAGVTGIVLAKLDGTARGGIVFAIASELGIPVRLIGTGEGLGDLAPFDAEAFVDALLA